MEKKQLYSIVTSTLKQIGFKHWKPSVWRRTGTEISDRVYLQRSCYGNIYYFHFGHIINKLPSLSGTYCHSFGKIDMSNYKEIQKVLDLENNLSDEERERELIKLLLLIVPEKNQINTERELKELIIKEQFATLKYVTDYLKIKLTEKGYEDAEEQSDQGTL